LEALPNVPTIGESARSFEASSVFSIDAPRNTPVEIVDTLNKKMNANLADPKIEAQFAELGGSVLAGSPAKFAKLIAHETEKWGQVIRMANIKPE
jgi:tripartite-type tricarboxylate transporter receptor subunit TctC